MGWAPKKSELYTAPPQDVSDAWLEHLCIHEFRHCTIRQGKPRFHESIILYLREANHDGRHRGICPHVVPRRGCHGIRNLRREKRAGTFTRISQRNESPSYGKRIYTYYKAVLGSYKDFVPNHYALGYYMVGNSRVHYGPGIWQDALSRVGKRPYGITPFARSLKLTMNEKRDSIWSSVISSPFRQS